MDVKPLSPLIQQASNLRRKGQYGEALAVCEQLIGISKGTHLHVRALYETIDLLRIIGKHEDALALLEKAKNTISASDGVDVDMNSRFKIKEAELLRVTGKAEQAESLYRLVATMPCNAALRLEAALGLAHLKRNRGDISGAEELLSNILATIDTIENEYVRNRFYETYLNLQYVVKLDGESYPQAVDVAEKRYRLLLDGLDDPCASERLLSSGIDLVYAQLKAGEETRARALLDRIEGKLNNEGKQWFSLESNQFYKLELWIASQLSKVYLHLNEWDKAKAILTLEDQYYQVKRVAVTTRWATCLYSLSKCYIGLNESEKATEVVSRAKDLLQQ